MAEVVGDRLTSDSKDRSRFGDPTRRRIARVVRDEALGAYAIARELGHRTNVITGTLKTMADEETLQVLEPEGREQRLYQLRLHLQSALDEAIAAVEEPGVLRRSQTVLLVRECGPAVVAAISPSRVAGALVWTSRLGHHDLLMAFEPDAGDLVVDQLEQLLVASGATVEQFTIRDVVAAHTFVEQARSLRHSNSVLTTGGHG